MECVQLLSGVEHVEVAVSVGAESVAFPEETFTVSLSGSVVTNAIACVFWDQWSTLLSNLVNLKKKSKCLSFTVFHTPYISLSRQFLKGACELADIPRWCFLTVQTYLINLFE